MEKIYGNGADKLKQREQEARQYFTDYEDADGKGKELISPCEMCYNARISDDPELTDETDVSYFTIGAIEKYRIMSGAGGGKPPRLLFEVWNEKYGIWQTIGHYIPKYCPNCGRKITEYEEKQKK